MNAGVSGSWSHHDGRDAHAPALSDRGVSRASPAFKASWNRALEDGEGGAVPDPCDYPTGSGAATRPTGTTTEVKLRGRRAGGGCC